MASRDEEKEESAVVKVAREAIQEYVKHGSVSRNEELEGKIGDRRAGAFVCIKKKGQLRGCIGTIEPQAENLAREIQNNAVSAATRDHRFPPVGEEELPDLEYSVDVLEEPEDIPDESKLDPREYGVIVRSGLKSGLLLPDLEGVDTPEQQVNIAKMKAGILPGEPYKIQRFKVTRYK